jgi:hypothetical protein
MADGSGFPDDPISDEEARGLLLRQEALQTQAAAALADLDLINLLSRHGQVTPVGSAATGLMVQPDIDVCVLADVWSPDAAFLAARPLASHPRVQKLHFWNEAGAFTPDGLDEGYYWGVHYVPAAGQPWKMDIWFWRPGAPAPDVEYAEMVRRRLTPETRLAILWIKDIARTPGALSPESVRSIDVYEAVLDHGVRTPAAFSAYLAAKGRPGRTDAEPEQWADGG